ncbi:hypothetical protein ILYODFUR_001707 [Ilyodon furcidens]|uniref:Uncharacterized protein n=1 Tax=Ilyodon furcidens TaxID=33524 RepID=A0ABV0UZD4_9TELE
MQSRLSIQNNFLLSCYIEYQMYLSLLTFCLKSEVSTFVRNRNGTAFCCAVSSFLSLSSVMVSLVSQSLCLLLILLSCLVKNLSGQPSDQLGDEAILILGGITAKLLVFFWWAVATE